MLKLNFEWLQDTVSLQIPLKRKKELKNLMKNSQENEEEVEGEDAEVLKEDMKEEQRPCYSVHTVTRPQIQARPPVPMVTSPRPARWQAGIG